MLKLLKLQIHLGASLKKRLFSWEKEPQPAEPWTMILDGTSEGTAPFQSEFVRRKVVGGEDCLFVNVFTKDVKPSTLRPVLVWIHGGGFASGSTSKDLYSPDYFMSKDVVMVSIAYRVGMFGFLTLKDPSLKVPGNAGLKDLVLGLKWVQSNISKFGGDPDNVTIFGESAGGSAVHFLGLTDQTKGLFHRMICMSGSAFCPWAKPPPRNSAERLAKELGYNGENNEADILKFLRTVDARKIPSADAKTISPEETLNGYWWGAYPVVEPYVTDQCILPQEPLIMAHDAWSNDIPMIAGCTSREGIFFNGMRGPNDFNEWNKNPVLLLPFDLKTDPDSEKCRELAQLVKKESLGDGKLTDENYIDYLSYKLFTHPVHRMILSRQKYAKAPTYLYVFDFDSPDYALLKVLGSATVPGVSHGDDLGYFFLNMLTPETSPGTAEQKVIKQLIGLWTQFAQTANPNCQEIEPVEWKPVSPDEKPHKCLRIAREVTFAEHPFADILQFWDNLYDEDQLF